MAINYDRLCNELSNNQDNIDSDIYSLYSIENKLYNFDDKYKKLIISNNIEYSFYTSLYFLLRDDLCFMYTNIHEYIINFKTIIVNNCIMPSIENISSYFNINIIIIGINTIEINKNCDIGNNFILIYKTCNVYHPIINIDKFKKHFNANNIIIRDLLKLKHINYNNVEKICDITNYNILNIVNTTIKNKICTTYLMNKKKEDLCNIYDKTDEVIKKLKKKQIIELILKELTMI